MAERGDRCVLCLDEKRCPVRITCGHSFCHECLDVYKSYQKYAWANRCPICRGSLKERRRSVKKPPTSSSTTTTTTTSSTSTTSTTSSSSSTHPAEPASATPPVPVEQIYLLEELMAIATDSDATEEDDFFSEEDLEPDPSLGREEREDFYYSEGEEGDAFGYGGDFGYGDGDDDYEDFDDEDDDGVRESQEDDEADEDVVMLDEVIIVD